jgi:hypothetical protein
MKSLAGRLTSVKVDWWATAASHAADLPSKWMTTIVVDAWTSGNRATGRFAWADLSVEVFCAVSGL